MNVADIKFIDVNELDTYNIIFVVDCDKKLYQKIIKKSIDNNKKINEENKKSIKDFNGTVFIDKIYYNLIYVSIKKQILKEEISARDYGYKIISSYIKEVNYTQINGKFMLKIIVQGEYIPC